MADGEKRRAASGPGKRYALAKPEDLPRISSDARLQRLADVAKLPTDADLKRRRRQKAEQMEAFRQQQRQTGVYTSFRDIVDKKRATYEELAQAFQDGEFDDADGRSGVLLCHPKNGEPLAIDRHDMARLSMWWIDPVILNEQYLGQCWWRTDLLRSWLENRTKLPFERLAAATDVPAEQRLAIAATRRQQGRKPKYNWANFATRLGAKLAADGCPVPGDGGQARLEE